MKYQVGDLLRLKYDNTDIYDRNGNVETHEKGEYFIVLSETPLDDNDADFVIVSQKTKSVKPIESVKTINIILLIKTLINIE